MCLLKDNACSRRAQLTLFHQARKPRYSMQLKRGPRIRSRTISQFTGLSTSVDK